MSIPSSSCRPSGLLAPLFSLSLALFAGTAHADDSKPPATHSEAAAKSGVSVHVVDGARVLVNSAEAGRAEPSQPFDLTLAPGSYTIRVLYDGGGNEKRKVLVTEGHVTQLEFRALPESRLIFEQRDRWLFGFVLGGGVYSPDTRGGLGPQFEGGLVLNRAFSKAVELRTIVGVHGWVADTRALQVDLNSANLGGDRVKGLGLTFTVEPEFVFHLGSVYTLGVSVAGRLGMAVPLASSAGLDAQGNAIPLNTTAAFAAGVAARASPVGIAFGENREHHIELVGGVAVSTVRGLGLDMGEIRYSMLFF